MQLWQLVAIIWLSADILTLVGMGLYSMLMFDSTISEHLSRTQRALMVLFGPVTIVVVVLVILPPTRFLMWAVHEVLLKK